MMLRAAAAFAQLASLVYWREWRPTRRRLAATALRRAAARLNGASRIEQRPTVVGALRSGGGKMRTRRVSCCSRIGGFDCCRLA